MIFIIVIIIICCLFIPANESEPKNENTETNIIETQNESEPKNENTETNIIETQLPRSIIDATMMHQVIK